MAVDHYGLAPRDWKPPSVDPPEYTSAGALGHQQAEELLAKAAAERFKDEVNCVADYLSSPDYARRLPSGSSVCMSFAGDPNAPPKATAVTVWPPSSRCQLKTR